MEMGIRGIVLDDVDRILDVDGILAYGKIDIEGILGIVFDFDGILANTEKLQWEKWNILLRELGLEEISLEEYSREYCGKSSKTEIPRRLKEKYGEKIPYSAEELAKRASEILEKLFRTQSVRLMPGTKEVLQFFQRNGLKMAVCSGENPGNLEMKLRAANLLDWFPPAYRSTQEEAKFPKPHPAMYQLAVKRLGLKPGECIAFEDTASGVESAVKAGLYVIALPNEFTKNQDFSSAHLVVYGGWPEILRIFERSPKIFNSLRGNRDFRFF